MSDDLVRDLYARMRSEGLRASDAFRYARSTDDLPELDWSNDGNRATFERDGFDLSVKIEPDDWTDLSWLGEFKDTREPGAIRNPRYEYERNVYEWFVPTYTYEERRDDFSKRGAGRGVADLQARRAVREDAKHAAEYQDYVVIVKASRHDVELGSAVVGGVTLGDDYDDARRYITETAHELADEAIHAARASLAALCGGEAQS